MQKQSYFLKKQLNAIYDPPRFENGLPYWPSDVTATQSPPSAEISFLHYHDDLEFGYCYSGSGVFIIDGLVIPYQSPCASIIYQKELHIARSNPAQPSEWVFLNLDTRAFFGGNPEMLNCICTAPNFGRAHIVTPESPVLLQYVYNFIEELRNKKKNYMECAKYLLLAALIEHGRQNRSPEIERPRQWLYQDIAAAITYISSHYDRSVSVEFLAKLCCMSTASLRRKFRLALNVSPLDYLHQVRIGNAISMLALDNFSIMEIGGRVGYNSPSSFNRQFLKITGKTPSEYRT